MSTSDDRKARLTELASDIAASFAETIEADRLDDVANESLGQLFASVVRLYAAKAQIGNPPRPFARNSGITPTDVMISATAMLEGVNVPLFDLALWQSWSTVGKRLPEDAESGAGS
ncbi:MAG TPA: hypothetical protein VN766_07040 [Stellaceae bacterium]|jgi:hypothetical protein|nr:hypothetical protein [Stellaceae bacterium]